MVGGFCQGQQDFRLAERRRRIRPTTPNRGRDMPDNSVTILEGSGTEPAVLKTAPPVPPKRELGACTRLIRKWFESW